jgi:hypothetical protein
VRPGVLGDLASFRRDFERPIAASNQKNATQAQAARGLSQSKELETISKTFMLRRLQKDVLKTILPPRTEALLFCQPSTRQKNLYLELAAGNRSLSTFGTDALTTLTALRKICSHPFLHQQQDSDEEPQDLKMTEDPARARAMSGKLVVLDALLASIRNTAPEDKVVIVSNFTSALSLIESLVLQPRRHSFLRLDGTVDLKNRQTLVDTFNRTSAENNFCFLLSSKAGGCGLNLVGANRLVMFGAYASACIESSFTTTRDRSLTSPAALSLTQTRTGILLPTFKRWVESTAKVRSSPARSIDCSPPEQWKKSFTSASRKRETWRLGPWMVLLPRAPDLRSLDSLQKRNLPIASR